MMRVASASGLTAALFLFPAVAFGACSAGASAPVFNVATKNVPINYRFDLDRAAMAEIANDNGMSGLKGEIPFGLTIGRYDLEVTVNSDSMRDAGGYCAQLRAAFVEIGLKQLDVIVDRRFVSGSCERQAVLDHEGQHVEVFREALRYYLPELERTLAQTPLPLTIRVADRSAARAAYIGQVTEALKPVLAAINNRARNGNRRLDVPESYAAVFKHCNQW